MVTLNELLLIVNALSCAISAMCIGTFQRSGARHRPFATFFAWLLVVACGAVTIFIATGTYGVASVPETAINVALCITVINARGNIMRLGIKGNKQ